MITVKATKTHSQVVVSHVKNLSIGEEIKIQQGSQKIYISQEMALALIAAISAEAQYGEYA